MANIEPHVYASVTPVTISLPKTYNRPVLVLTRYFAKLSISPESSDGFASVGTILPKEEATLLPGGLFAFRIQLSSDEELKKWLAPAEKKKLSPIREHDEMLRCKRIRDRREAPKKEVLC